MSYSTVDSRILEDQTFDDDKWDGFAKLGSDSEEEDDEFIPLWVAMVAVAIFAVCITGILFYVSYRQEWCCGVHSSVDDFDDDPEQGTKKIPTKTFTDSNRFERLTPSVALGEDSNTFNMDESAATQKTAGSINSSERTRCSTAGAPSERQSTVVGKANNMPVTSSLGLSMITPRCVLCSKNFQVGENVTHSSNPTCHHEYHEPCLQNYWKKSKNNKDKCPVCKATYVVECIAPSQHFSTIHFSTTNNSKEEGKKEVAPFDV